MSGASSAARKQLALWTDPKTPIGPPIPLVSESTSLAELSSAVAVVARLLEIDWEFTREDTQYLGHDLHPYPAKFIPQIPANLIAGLSLRGEVVWDPFGGSGTTALEALLLGRNAISTDANPLASLICKAKCSTLSPEQRAELASLKSRVAALVGTPDLEKLLSTIRHKSPRELPGIPNMLDWFSQASVEELFYIREEINTLSDPSCRIFAQVALSSIVITSSFQDGETRYARRPRTLPPGRVLASFAEALEDSLIKHEPLERLLGYRQPLVETADIRTIAQSNLIEEESVDLVVTSPPYANSNDYHLYHRFRLFWLGYDPRDLGRCEIGSHLRHQREGRGYALYEQEMSEALEQIWSRLRPGRYAAFVLGDSVFDGKTISTSNAMERIAERQGFEAVGTISRDVHPTRRSFITAARRAKCEEILVLRKPPRRLLLTFHPPSYKMWPYEETLRCREISALLGVNCVHRRNEVVSAQLDCYHVDKARRLTFTHSIEDESGKPRWYTWQKLLENGDLRSARKDPKYLTHGIHPYKGKFYPQLAKCLLNLADLSAGATVLDPFCGSGTVLLESQLSGFMPTGLDLNPLAVLISKAKVGVAAESTVILDRLMKDFFDRVAEDRSRSADFEHFKPELRDEIERWFPLSVARRLGWVLSMIERVPHTTANLVLRVLLSSIIRDVSQQAPEDLRIRRRKKLIHDAPVLELFRARIRAFRERLRHFGEKMSCAPVAFHPGEVVLGDSRSFATFQNLSGRPYDCVVTSPPYATALPYIDTDRLSLLTIFGLDPTSRARIEETLTGSREIRERHRRELEGTIARDLDDRLGSKTAADVVRKIHFFNTRSTVGFRKRNMSALLVRYFSDMYETFRNLAQVMRPGAHLFFVIGDNKTQAGDHTMVIPSGKALREIGRIVGWRLRDSVPISVTREAPLHSRHAITENMVLHFEAP